MKISQISSTNFSSKQYFLEEDSLKHFNDIKKKMNNSVSTLGVSKDSFYISKVIYINTNDVFFVNTKPADMIIGKSKLNIDDNGIVDIYEKKPFYRTKRNIMKKLSEYLAIFNNMYKIDSVVKKGVLSEFVKVDKTTGKLHVTEKKWIRR